MNNNVWDVVDVRIGSGVRGSGSSGPRQAVARSNAEINQAKRTGAFVGTEKKFATGNAAKGNTVGQRAAKLDRADDIIKPSMVGPAVGSTIIKRRNELKMNQKDLAGKCFITQSQLGSFESGNAAPDQKVFGALERALGVKLRGSNIGDPLFGPKKTATPAPAKGKKKGNKGKEEKPEGTEPEGKEEKPETTAEGEEKPADSETAEPATEGVETPKADGDAAKEQK